jgi:hypothetical protein
MDDTIYIEFLVEDTSGKMLLEILMEKYTENKSNVIYKINGFKGIGRLPKKIEKITNVKTRSLLNDLPAYLKGFSNSLSKVPFKKAVIVVVDCDDKDRFQFKKDLVEMAEKLELKVDTIFCIAVEEMESWLLGDTNAVLSAYPNAKRALLQSYVPDSIIGTWELLADIVYLGGVAKLKKNAVSYYEIGEQKCMWATKIGEYMELRHNNSPSFNYLLAKIDQLCS